MRWLGTIKRNRMEKNALTKSHQFTNTRFSQFKKSAARQTSAVPSLITMGGTDAFSALTPRAVPRRTRDQRAARACGTAHARGCRMLPEHMWTNDCRSEAWHLALNRLYERETTSTMGTRWPRFPRINRPVCSCSVTWLRQERGPKISSQVLSRVGVCADLCSHAHTGLR